jgi:hypothetical protein
LQGKRGLPDSLGIALLLAPPGHGTALDRPGQATRLRIRLLSAEEPGTPTPCRDAGLESLRLAIPAARGLPLLEALADGRPGAQRRLILGDAGAMRLEIDLP